MVKPAECIETLRVAWERDLEARFAHLPLGLRKPAEDSGAADPRVLLDPTMAARVHRIANEVADTLGCTDPFFIYQTPQARQSVNAQLLTREVPFGIRLIGPVANLLDDRALAALIGHEMGHFLALGPHAEPPSIISEAYQRGAPQEDWTLGTLAAEITAERFALLAVAGELEAIVRLDVASMTLDSPAALGVRELEYLTAVQGKIERRETSLFADGGYPSPEFRLYGSWLFWRTGEHRDMTGVGPGDTSLREVDATLWRMAREALQTRSTASTEVTRRRESQAGPAAPPRETGSPGSVPRLAPPRPTVEQRAVAVVEGAASKLSRTLSDLVDRMPRPRAERPALETVDLSDLDDLEQRFRALERAARASARAPRPPVRAVDDLEARFRELEERAKKGS